MCQDEAKESTFFVIGKKNKNNMVYKCFRVGLKQNGCTLKLQFVNFLFRGC